MNSLKNCFLTGFTCVAFCMIFAGCGDDHPVPKGPPPPPMGGQMGLNGGLNGQLIPNGAVGGVTNGNGAKDLLNRWTFVSNVSGNKADVLAQFLNLDLQKAKIGKPNQWSIQNQELVVQYHPAGSEKFDSSGDFPSGSMTILPAQQVEGGGRITLWDLDDEIVFDSIYYIEQGYLWLCPYPHTKGDTKNCRAYN